MVGPSMDEFYVDLDDSCGRHLFKKRWKDPPPAIKALCFVFWIVGATFGLISVTGIIPPGFAWLTALALPGAVVVLLGYNMDMVRLLLRTFITL
jgi:hypothetical protein